MLVLVLFPDNDGRAVDIEIVELVEGHVGELAAQLDDDGDTIRCDLVLGERLLLLIGQGPYGKGSGDVGRTYRCRYGLPEHLRYLRPSRCP